MPPPVDPQGGPTSGVEAREDDPYVKIKDIL